MGKPMTIQEHDDQRLETLKIKCGAKSKIEVLRKALTLLEEELRYTERVAQWKNAVKNVGDESSKVNKEFRVHSKLKRVD